HQSQNKNLIIPPKPLSQLNKIITHTHQHIHIFFPSNQLLFTLPNINFISPLLQRHYPHTTPLFPQNYHIKLPINNAHFYHPIHPPSLLPPQPPNNLIKLT
ncbi:DNA polymerase III subunit beta family protein, partial [Staphylococcus epidermidis]